MNERITELMIQAGKTIPGDKHIDADFCEKFAELIVEECMSNLYLHGYDDAAKCLQDIHFGIEELV